MLEVDGGIMNRRTLLAASFAAGFPCNGAGAAVPPPLQVRRPDATPDTIIVPAQIVRGAFVVEARIAGHALRFGIDTGVGARVALTPETIARLGLPKLRSEELVSAVGQATAVTSIHGPVDLILGEALFAGVDVYATPADLGLPLDGILGLRLFQDWLLTMDYAAASLRLSKAGRLPVADGLDVHDFSPDQGLILIELRIGEARFPAELDTGNLRSGLLLPQSLAMRLPRRGAPGKIGTIRNFAGATDLYELKLDAPVMLDRQRLPIVWADYIADQTVANIGAESMKGCVLTIDLRSRRLRWKTP